MIFLIIDSSTKKLSLSIIKNDVCIASYFDEIENSHAKKITAEIDRLIIKANIQISDISAIVLNEGPGSFTGLRVGSSVAKGICFGRDIPLIKITGMEAYGIYYYNFFEETYSDIFILLDARKDNYFYSHISKGKVVESAAFRNILDIEAKVAQSERPWLFYSNKQKEVDLKSEFLKDAALEKWNQNQFENIQEFEPLYMINNYQKK